MAKAGDGGGADSWPGLLSELTKSFLILRDIFGYALPGAVFLAIGIMCRRFSLHDVQYFLAPYTLPSWLAAILGLGACYVVGHLMAQLAFFFSNTWKIPLITKLWRAAAAKIRGGEPAPKADGVTHASAGLILLRGQHPELLTELERQSTMTQLRGSTGAAMLVGYLVFYRFSTPPLGWMMGVAGAFVLIVFWFSANPHIGDLQANTIAAGAKADAAAKAAKTIDPATLKQTLEDFISAAQDALKKL